MRFLMYEDFSKILDVENLDELHEQIKRFGKPNQIYQIQLIFDFNHPQIYGIIKPKQHE